MASINDLAARIQFLGITDPEVLSLIDDISNEYAMLEQQVETMSAELSFDKLTQLPSKENFITYLTNQLNLLRASEQQTQEATVFLAIGDLDNFKSINDHFGHNEGDNALKHVANILRETVRSSDLISRLHGDEFGFVFTRMSNSDHAEETKQRIKQALVSRTFEVNNHKVPISMSIGIIPCDVSMSIGQHLVAADKAMYLEKASCKKDHTF